MQLLLRPLAPPARMTCRDGREPVVVPFGGSVVLGRKLQAPDGEGRIGVSVDDLISARHARLSVSPAGVTLVFVLGRNPLVLRRSGTGVSETLRRDSSRDLQAGDEIWLVSAPVGSRPAPAEGAGAEGCTNAGKDAGKERAKEAANDWRCACVVASTAPLRLASLDPLAVPWAYSWVDGRAGIRMADGEAELTFGRTAVGVAALADPRILRRHVRMQQVIVQDGGRIGVGSPKMGRGQGVRLSGGVSRGCLRVKACSQGSAEGLGKGEGAHAYPTPPRPYPTPPI